MTKIFQYMPCEIISSIEKSGYDQNKITEIRLRRNMPIAVTINGKTQTLNSPAIFKEELENILYSICNKTISVYEDDIAQGFVTLETGDRVGIGGEFFYDKLLKKNILKEIYSLNFRIARDNVFFINQDKLNNTLDKSILIIGPPHSGKTSLTKLYIKVLSKSYRVSICDERSELSITDLASFDIIKGINKAAAIQMSTRTLNPQFIICDEIGLLDESKQILSAMNTGVKFICTAHGNSIKSIKSRPNINLLLENGVFEKIVILKQSEHNFYIEDIIDV